MLLTRSKVVAKCRQSGHWWPPLVLIGVAGLTVPGPGPARAMPVVTGDLTIVENRPVDDFFGYPGLHLLTRVDVTHPGGSAALTGPPAGAKVSSNNSDPRFATPPVLTQFTPGGLTGASTWSELFSLTPAQLSAVEGVYTYTVTDNNSQSTTHVGNRINFPAVVPHPTNLAVSDYSTTPLFTFTDPSPTPAHRQLTRVYDVVIFDSSKNEIAILPSPTTSSDTPEFQIPPGLLSAGLQYWFRAQSIDIDRDGNEFHVENIGESLLSFTAVPESSHIMAIGGTMIGLLAVRERRRDARTRDGRSA